MLARPLEWLDATGRHLAAADAGLGRQRARKRLLQVVAASGGTVLLGAIGTVVSFVLTLFVLFFVLRDGPRIATDGRADAADRAGACAAGSGVT